eukprot:gene15076-biopygen1066
MIASMLDAGVTTEQVPGEEEERLDVSEGEEDADAAMADAGESSDSEDAEATGAKKETRQRAELALLREQRDRIQAESNGHAISAKMFSRELDSCRTENAQLRQDVTNFKAIAEGYEQDTLRYQEELAKANERVDGLSRENALLVQEKGMLHEKLEFAEGKAQSNSSARVLAAALSKPPTFDGKGLLQTKGAQQVEDWVNMVQRYTNSLKLDDADAVAVAVAASLLRDEAARAWSSTEVVMQASNEPLTLDALKKCLLTRFTPAATVFKTRKQLHSLQLGKGACKTLPQYVQEYDRIAALIPDLGDAEKLHHFVEGIERGAPDLVQRCCIDPTTSALFTDYSRLRAATLNAAVHAECLGSASGALDRYKEKTAKWDSNPAGSKKPKLKDSYSSKAAAGASGSGAGSSGAGSSGAGGNGAGGQKQGKPRCPLRTPEQRDFCTSKGLCMRCYQRGHMRNECPAAESASGNPPGMPATPKQK